MGFRESLTILCELGGADLCLDEEVVSWAEHVVVDYLRSAGIIYAGQCRVLEGTSRGFLVLGRGGEGEGRGGGEEGRGRGCGGEGRGGEGRGW